MSHATTRNGFLGGRLTVEQPEKGYRAGVDPVFLAASVPARPGQSVLELGCGVGTASLCLLARVPGLAASAVELMPDYADLARQNAHGNDLPLDVHTGDLANLPGALRQQRFDHVLANPPYFDRAASTAAQDQGRETALGEGTPLDVWLDVASRRLAPKGTLTLIHRAEKLPALLSGLPKDLGSVQVLPLAARTGRDAGLILLRARKGGRAAFRLHAPVILHQGQQHGSDGEDYAPDIRAVLRDGAAMPWPG